MTRTRELSIGVARAGPLPRGGFCGEMIDLRLQCGNSLELNVERQLDRVQRGFELFEPFGRRRDVSSNRWM